MKTLILNASVICVAYSALNFLPTLKRSAKMQNFVFSLCFLASFLSAMSIVSFSDISLPILSNETEISSYNDEAFCLAIGDMLSKENIKYEKIEADTTENDDKSISINKITVYGCSDVLKCQNIIEENTGLGEVCVYE